MKIELQVISPGTSNYMQLIGVRLKSEFMYKYNSLTKKSVLEPSGKSIMGSSKNFSYSHAYSIGELGMMIPWGFFQSSPVHKLPGGIWQMKRINGKTRNFASEVEARAWYLIDLLEEQHVTIDQVNKPEILNQQVLNELIKR